MSVRHVMVLASPQSRHGGGQEVANAAVDAFRSSGVDAVLEVGSDVSHASDLARDAASSGTDALVVCGGDGSIRLALEASYGSGTPIGVIPAGSGNDMARNLGIPLHDPLAAVEVIVAGHTRRMDIGRTTFPDGDSHLFTTVAATGFDASVTERASRMGWPKGQSRYTLAALLELVRLRSRHYRIRVDDETCEEDLVFAAIGNATSYGGGMQVTPAASMFDGAINLTVARYPARLPRTTIARLFPTVFSGAHVRHALVSTWVGTEVELYCDPTALVSLDGDLVGQLPAVFEVIPDALEVFAPPAQ